MSEINLEGTKRKDGGANPIKRCKCICKCICKHVNVYVGEVK